MVEVGFMYVVLVIRGKGSRSVRALADTGSVYIVLDPGTVSEIGLLETPYNVELTPADKGVLRIRRAEEEYRRAEYVVVESGSDVENLIK